MPSEPGAADPLDLVGRTLDGRYQVVAYLGGGDLGHVYRAEQAALHRACVIKVLRPEVQHDPARRSRVLHGSQQIARLHLDSLVAPDDLLISPERTAIVTPLLTGEDLGAHLRRAGGRLPWTETRDILQQIVIALSELHAAGLVFAGLKPSNVFLARSSDGLVQVKLLDVGTSRHDVTTASAAYMAPEWASGAMPDASADIYSLGSLAYEMSTGQPVFTGTPAQVALMHRFKPPRPLRSLAPDAGIPPQAEALILGALEKSPAARPGIATFLELVGGAPQPIRGEISPAPVPDLPPGEDTQTLAGDLVFTPGSIGVSFRSETVGAAPPTARPVVQARPVIAARRSQSGELPDDDRGSAGPLRVGAWPVESEPETRTIVTGPDGTIPGGDPRTLRTPGSGLYHAPGATAVLDGAGPRTAIIDGFGGVDDLGDGGPRTAIIDGFGGSLLLDPDQAPAGLRPAIATAAAATAVPAPTAPARPGLLARLGLRSAPPVPGTPAKVGWLARMRQRRAARTVLPARRGQSWLDRLLRALQSIPSYIGRGWRFVTRPFARANGLRGKLSAPLMGLRGVFTRVSRLVARWTGGGDT